MNDYTARRAEWDAAYARATASDAGTARMHERHARALRSLGQHADAGAADRLALGVAMSDLRAATGDATYGHTARAGRLRLVRIVYDERGRSTVTPMSDWATVGDHLATIRTLTRAARKVVR